MRKIKNKKGISEIIVTVIMIGLVLALGIVVWTVVSNLVKGKLQSTESCFGNFGKLNLNSQYTCYNNSASPKEFVFSISRGDIDVDKVIVSISSQSVIKSYTLPAVNYTNVKMFGALLYNSSLVLPDKNGGVTYVTKDFSSPPDSIKIAPVINGQQCDPSDTLNTIENC